MYGQCVPPSTGNWDINATCSLSNQIINLNGNLNVQDAGNLTFKNVTLRMNGTNDGEYGINVKSGGKFYIYDNDNNPTTTNDASNITNGANSSFNFFFTVDSGSTFAMKNGFLSYCGWSFDSVNTWKNGLDVHIPLTEFSGNTLTKNYIGLYLSTSTNSVIVNNTIVSNNFYGVYVRSSSSIVFNNNNISSNYGGLYSCCF